MLNNNDDHIFALISNHMVYEWFMNGYGCMDMVLYYAEIVVMVQLWLLTPRCKTFISDNQNEPSPAQLVSGFGCASRTQGGHRGGSVDANPWKRL